MRFEAFSFGSIRIGGVTYEHDVVIDFFQPSGLSPDEAAPASKMLESITLDPANENLEQARVEGCTK